MRLEDTLLKELSEARGISSKEDGIRKIILKAIKDYVDDVHVDSMGNIIALQRGNGSVNLRVLLAAHMDEVGFMVTGFDGNGTIKVRNVGGIDGRLLPAMRVEIGEKKIPGVFTWRPIHMSGHERDVKKVDDMRIDIGVDSKDAAKGKVKLGDMVTFVAETVTMHGPMVRGKAFDDRAGCVQIIELLKGGPYPVDVIAAFTVQEEVGVRGASVLVAATKPDAAIVLETTASHELPQDEDEPDQTSVTQMGHGPALYVMDRRTIYHPTFRKHFEDTADKYGIPYQYRSPQFAGGTDAGVIHISGAGVPTVAMSTPCRYLHSPHIIMNLDDFAHGIDLVRHVLNDLTPDKLER